MNDVIRTADEYGAYRLTYDQIVELLVDVESGLWVGRRRKVLSALRELQQRRIDEKVAHNLALAKEPV